MSEEKEKLAKIASLAIDYVGKINNLMKLSCNDQVWREYLAGWADKFEDSVISSINPAQKATLPTDIHLPGKSRAELLSFYVGYEIEKLLESRMYHLPGVIDWSSESPVEFVRKRIDPIKTYVIELQQYNEPLLRKLCPKGYYETPFQSFTEQSAPLNYWLECNDSYFPDKERELMIEISKLGLSIRVLGECLSNNELSSMDREMIGAHWGSLQFISGEYAEYRQWRETLEIEDLPKSLQIAGRAVLSKIAEIENGIAADRIGR